MSDNDKTLGKVLGYLDYKTSSGVLVPIVVRSLVTKIVPDYRGERTKLTQLEFLHPSRYSVKEVDYCNEKFIVPLVYSEWQLLPFFQYEEKSFTYNYLRISSKYDWHPEFSFKPLYSYKFDDIYKDFTLEDVIDYLKSCESSLCEKSYYCAGPGKDDRIEVYCKFKFRKPRNKTFFIDLLQMFDIHWCDKDDDHFGIASELGNGFYKYTGIAHYYKQVGAWSVVPHIVGINELIKWFENLKVNYPV